MKSPGTGTGTPGFLDQDEEEAGQHAVLLEQPLRPEAYLRPPVDHRRCGPGTS